jgi:hypothetical protein
MIQDGPKSRPPRRFFIFYVLLNQIIDQVRIGPVIVSQKTINEMLPDNLKYLVDEEWIPRGWVRCRHSDHPRDHILALFTSSRLIQEFIPAVSSLAGQALPARWQGCDR